MNLIDSIKIDNFRYNKLNTQKFDNSGKGVKMVSKGRDMAMLQISLKNGQVSSNN